MPSELQVADGLTKDVGDAADGLRGLLLTSEYTIADEAECPKRRAFAKEQRLQRAAERQAAAEAASKPPQPAGEDRGEEENPGDEGPAAGSGAEEEEPEGCL